MVLELIAIGGVAYYYVQKNKKAKAKKAAFAAGQPFANKDGSLTYPPDHPGLPPYTPMANDTNTNNNTYPNTYPNTYSNTNMYNNAPAMRDYKRQEFVPQSNARSVSVPVQGGVADEYRYRDVDEKAPLVVQTREAMDQKY